MEALALVGFFVLVVAIFGGVLALIVYAGRRRRRTGDELAELVELARRRGWTYVRSDAGFADRFSGGEPFPTRSHNLRAWDLITGTYRDRPFCCFEYRRRIYHPERRTRREMKYWRIFAVRTSAKWPKLQVERAGFGSKVLEVVGLRDVELEHPEFDEAFRVTTEDERFAHDVLNIDTRLWLLEDRRAHEIPFRLERDELITWQRGRLTAPSVDPALDYLCDVLDRVPAPRAG